MKKIFLVAVLATVSVVSMAQTNFTSGSLKDGLAAAAKADKLVFVDIYATWCKPCQYMTDKIFPEKSVGELMNAAFVSMAFDAENGEGIELAKRYGVKAYPTMLILDSKGNEIGRLLGSDRTPADFIRRVKEASGRS